MVKKNSEKGADNSAPAEPKLRIAVVMKDFINSFNYAPHLNDKCFRSWNRGQIIFNENEIEDLIKLNAPIRIFIEDVD